MNQICLWAFQSANKNSSHSPFKALYLQVINTLRKSITNSSHSKSLTQHTLSLCMKFLRIDYHPLIKCTVEYFYSLHVSVPLFQPCSEKNTPEALSQSRTVHQQTRQPWDWYHKAGMTAEICH